MDDASQMTPSAARDSYPVQFSVEYQESLSRLSTLFRLVLVIPVLVFVAILTGGDFFSFDQAEDATTFSIGALGSLIVAHWIVILLRKRPVGWYGTRS